MLNKTGPTGPDLANQIVGVLLRFRKEHVVFMADIKSMFYQVLAPPQKKVVNYQICTYIFGGTSSSSCSNFALKKAAIDNSDKFGQEAAKTLLKNFYVGYKRCRGNSITEQECCPDVCSWWF